MALTLGALLEASLLVVNAICVLHEKRFLAKVGWASDNARGFEEQLGVKAQILNIIHSTRTVMRIPLIFVNSLVIIKKTPAWLKFETTTLCVFFKSTTSAADLNL